MLVSNMVLEDSDVEMIVAELEVTVSKSLKSDFVAAFRYFWIEAGLM